MPPTIGLPARDGRAGAPPPPSPAIAPKGAGFGARARWVGLAGAATLLCGARAHADVPTVAAKAPGYDTTVTASPTETAAPAPREDRAGAASVVVPADSPRAREDLGTLMLEVPGVSTTRTGSAASFTTLSLRGSNPDQVRVFVDGVPLAIAEGGAVDLSTLPLGDVERVEVYRGQAPLAFGESAMGGILSITTRTPGTPGVTAGAGVGSFGTRFGDVTAGGTVGPARLPVRLYFGAHALRSTGDYPYLDDNCTTNVAGDDTWTTRRNDDVSQADGALRAAVDLGGRRTLSLGVIAFARDQGLPGASCTQTRSVRFSTGRATSYLRLDDRSSLGAGGRLTAMLFASGQRDHDADPLGELSAGPRNTHDDTLSAGARADASRPLAGWLRLAAVLEARAESFRPENDADPQPVGMPARRLLVVGGVEPTIFWRRANLEILPSARVELQQDVVTGRDPLLQTQRPADAPLDRALPVWRLALIRPLVDNGALAVALKANVGRYERAPSFLELYAGVGRLIGNPALVPERGTNGDVALTLDVTAPPKVVVSSRTAAFGARVDDLIEWEQNPYGQARADNIAGARVLGLEEELRLRVGPWTRFVAQGTYLDAEDHSGVAAHEGKQLPFRPRWRGYVRPELAGVHFGHEDRALRFGVYVDGTVVVGAYDTPSNIRELPPRFLLGAGVSAEVPRWGVRAVLSGQDLTRTWTNDMAYYPVPGRTIYLALAWQAGASNNRSRTTNEERETK